MRINPIIFLLFVTSWCLSSGIQAQTIITKLDSLSRCPDSLIMPVMVEDFQDVASLSLKINYDTTSLKYKGYQNLNPALAGSFLMNGFNGQVIMSWFSLNPVTIGTGLMVEIKFFYKNNTDVVLSWDDSIPGNCAYTDLDGNELPAVFEDGIIHGLMQTPEGLSPADHSTGIPTTTLLHWSGSGCTPLYSLELATDSLFINPVLSNPSIFGTSLPVSNLNLETTYFWRIKAFNANFTTAWSAIRRFKTTTVGVIENSGLGTQGIILFPNPTGSHTTITFAARAGVSYMITVYGIDGTIRKQYSTISQFNMNMNYVMENENLSPGIYLVVLSEAQNGQKVAKPARMIMTGQE